MFRNNKGRLFCFVYTVEALWFDENASRLAEIFLTCVHPSFRRMWPISTGYLTHSCLSRSVLHVDGFAWCHVLVSGLCWTWPTCRYSSRRDVGLWRCYASSVARDELAQSTLSVHFAAPQWLTSPGCGSWDPEAVVATGAEWRYGLWRRYVVFGDAVSAVQGVSLFMTGRLHIQGCW